MTRYAPTPNIPRSGFAPGSQRIHFASVCSMLCVCPLRLFCMQQNVMPEICLFIFRIVQSWVFILLSLHIAPQKCRTVRNSSFRPSPANESPGLKQNRFPSQWMLVAGFTAGAFMWSQARRQCGPKEKQEGVDQKRMLKKIRWWWMMHDDERCGRCLAVSKDNNQKLILTVPEILKFSRRM